MHIALDLKKGALPYRTYPFCKNPEGGRAMRNAVGVRLTVLLGLVLQIGVAPLHPQIVTGSIVGVALDPTGAVVPGAQITLVNVNTKLSRSVSTDSTGGYSFPALPPGKYDLTATAPGFEKREISGIILEVGQTVQQDVQLSLGAATQEVTVQAAPLAIEGQTSSVGQVVDQQRVENLPLNGRNFMQLAQISSGVAPAYTTRSATITNQSGRTDLAVHISGGRGDSNSYLIDGVETRSMWFNSPSILLSVDTIQEFKVQKNLFDARYGQGSGIVSLITRSGSNTFHGSAYEFIRNDRVNAANLFDNFFSRQKPSFRQNQFGFSAGGRIRKDKLFFFGGYEGFRVRQGNTLSALIPTPAQLAGDLRGLSGRKMDPVTGQPAIVNPFSGQPFLNNQIQRQLLSSVVQKFKSFIPAPNANISGRNLVVGPTTRRGDDQFSGRLDYNISSRDTLFGRYIFFNSTLLRPGIAPLFGNVFPYAGQNFVLEETHLFSPTFLNAFKFGFNRGRVFNSWQNTSTSIVAELGIKNLQQVPAEFGLPNFGVTGFAGLGGTGINQGGIDNVYQFSDEMSWSHGRHGLSFGADIRRIQFQERLGLNNNGTFSFDGRYSGNSLADFLLGTIANATAQQGLGIANWRSTSYNFFVEDDFKATSRLTLNFGLRYEYDQPFYEIDGKEGFFDTSARRMAARIRPGFAPLQLPETQVLLDPNFRRGIWEPDRNNWAPRFGFAFRLAQSTVLRGGYGIFYSKTQGNELQGKVNFPPLVITNSLVASLTTPTVLLDRDAFPSPAALTLGTLSPFSVDPSDRTPYLQQWNLGVQHTFGNSLLTELAYVGSLGRRLAERIQINQAVPPPDPSNPTPIAQRRPFSGWGDILSFNYGEKSNYNGLQFRAERRFSQALSFLASYTWSHSLDTASRGSGGTWHQDIRNREADYGNSDFDVRHRFSFSYTYELPIGRGRRFVSKGSGALDKLVEGWSVNGITTFMTGNYENIVVSGDRANTGGFPFQRANLNPTCMNYGNLPRGQRTIDRYFRTRCFTVTPFGTFGSSGRNVVEIPGLNNWDLSLFKTTTVTESFRVQFRTEFFNAWNHPQFGGPSTNVQDPFFGQIRSARDPRVIQFALKLLW